MFDIADARVLTRNFTRFEYTKMSDDLVEAYGASAAEQPRNGIHLFIDSSHATRGTLCHGGKSGNASWNSIVAPEYDFSDVTIPWNRPPVTRGYVVALHTRATSLTATTVSTSSGLMRRRMRDKRLKRLSPERRAIYERIKKLRDEIGPVEFDIVEALRELRASI